MNFVYKLLLIGGAGGLGAVSRYLLAGLMQTLTGVGVPFGTLVVNVLGCLGAGFAWAWMERFGSLDTELRVVVLVGFFGAFTTFSTFALETMVLVRGAHWFSAMSNVLLHNFLGMFALVLGVVLAKAVL